LLDGADQSFAVNLSQLPRGVYLLQLKTESATKSTRIVLQ
jgi:hypothetical protein